MSLWLPDSTIAAYRGMRDADGKAHNVIPPHSHAGTLNNMDASNIVSAKVRKRQAFQFNGTNEWIDLGTADAIRDDLSDGLTIIARIYHTGDQASLYMIVACTTGSATQGYYLGIYQGDLRMQVSAELSIAFAQTDDKIPHNGWAVVAGVYWGHEVYLYVDGVIQSASAADFGSGSFTSVDSVTIGARDSGLTHRYIGSISDLLICDGPLSGQEIVDVSRALARGVS